MNSYKCLTLEDLPTEAGLYYTQILNKVEAVNYPQVLTRGILQIDSKSPFLDATVYSFVDKKVYDFKNTCLVRVIKKIDEKAIWRF